MASCPDRSSTSEQAALIIEANKKATLPFWFCKERSTETNLTVHSQLMLQHLRYIGGLLPPPTRRVKPRAAAVTFERI